MSKERFLFLLEYENEEIKAPENNIICLNILSLRLYALNPVCTESKPHSFQQGYGKYISIYSISRSGNGTTIITRHHIKAFDLADSIDE